MKSTTLNYYSSTGNYGQDKRKRKKRIAGVPVLQGVIDYPLNGGCPTIKVFCPHCKIHHTHIWSSANGNKTTDLRFAKCTNPQSPFLDTGYYVEKQKGVT